MRFVLIILLFCSTLAFGQTDTSIQADTISPKDTVQSQADLEEGVHFFFGGDTLYTFYSDLGPFTPEDRKIKFEKHFRKAGLARKFDHSKLVFTDTDFGAAIRYGNIKLLTVTPEDARKSNRSVFNLVQVTREKIGNALHNQSQTWAWGEIVIPFLSIVALILFGFLWYRWIRTFYRFLKSKTEEDAGEWFAKTKFRNYAFIDAKRGQIMLGWALKLLRIVVLGIGYYVLLLLVFSLFPATEGMAQQLFDYVVQPFLGLFQGLIAYIPNLIKMVVIIFIARSIVRFLAYLSDELEKGSIEIPGFYKDWANPTFNIFRFLVYAFTFIVIYPYLPGSESPIFIGVTVFLGCLLALGAIPSAQNFIAGIVMTYMRPFRIGDRVKMGEHNGVVVEKNILSVRIRTSKNEDITVPSGMVLSQKTVNFSSNVEKNGVILHTTIVVGFNVPWQKVHELLEQASNKCEKILKDPRPFVLEKEISKLGVHYQINAFTNNATQINSAYAELYRNILDVFNEANIPLGGR